jgi:hypothetical protein
LQRHDREHRAERLGDVGDIEHVLGVLLDVVVALGGDGDDVPAPGAHLLDVAHHLFVLAALVGDEDRGHALVDEGDRAVLHLRGGHALGVDVRDFLEFERAFEGGRVVVAAAQEEPVLAVDVLLGDLLDASF